MMFLNSLLWLPPTKISAPASLACFINRMTLSIAFWLISGVICTPSFRPLPNFSAETLLPKRLINSSYRVSCTKILLAHTQVCPELRNLLAIKPSIASSISASSNTINGALPPSSMVTFCTFSADCAISFLPTAVEPVNEILRTRGLDVKAWPISLEAVDGTMFTTPLGISA